MWYREGTITFTQGSNTLVGAGTSWNVTANGVLPGMIVIGPDNKLYEIKRVTSDTNIVLSEPYTGETQSEVPCRIITTYEGDLTQFSARFTALMSRMSADSKSMRSWLTALDEVTIEREDGTEVTVKPLMQIVNEHNENVEWYKNHADVIVTASDKAKEAAASAAEAAESASIAREMASQASQSASSAALSQSAASTSASAAKTSETNANASKEAAAKSASTASTKASEAAASASSASASKDAAKMSEDNASSSASDAARSATSAANSAKDAKTSELNAKTSETAAEKSAETAENAKTSAASSANAASKSEEKAATSAASAGKSAESASLSAKTATDQASIATNNASEAKKAAEAAKISEKNAKTSENSAAESKNSAMSSATSASLSASSASTSRDEASNKAAEATRRATEASQKASESAASASQAGQSKKEAESAAARAEAAAARAEEIAEDVALSDASTTKKGIVKLSNSTDSTSQTEAATPLAVKNVMDETRKKAPLHSPAFTGNPTTPTPPDNASGLETANAAFVRKLIAALVGSAPGTLDTLNELAKALGNDPNFATTVTNALASKQPLNDTLTSLSKLASVADRLPYFNGKNSLALTSFSTVGRDLLSKSTVKDMRTHLELKSAAMMEPQSDIYDRNDGKLALPGALGFGAFYGKTHYFSASDGPFDLILWCMETPPGRYRVEQRNGPNLDPIIPDINFAGILEIKIADEVYNLGDHSSKEKLLTFYADNGDVYRTTTSADPSNPSLNAWMPGYISKRGFAGLIGNDNAKPEIGSIVLAAYYGTSDSDSSRTLQRGTIYPGSRLAHVEFSAGTAVGSGVTGSTPVCHVRGISSSYSMPGSYRALSGSQGAKVDSSKAIIGLFVRVR
ncbi:phage tail protein [Escherichia coli]|uniref:phage tail protein n=1 Tax=Escherichia coli TaxID=562 RepID=UPI0013024909|nr:phage tail protein [Escherichia coli]KAE9753729.1 hypothetical protein GP701_17635 [Escherichia coli]MWL10282.1 hypothetical protein [Escherichia coli]MWL18917.1 hypothetical protein [Escherichia coli]MWL42752.1 hypothetical protein [Escherichia coli]MWL54187.1 hypothetical protein [Escherichia coli]